MYFLTFYYIISLTFGYVSARFFPTKGKSFWNVVNNSSQYFFDKNKIVGHCKMQPLPNWENLPNHGRDHFLRQLNRFAALDSLTLERFLQYGFNYGACIAYNIKHDMKIWPI
jgi:hypothetical protein